MTDREKLIELLGNAPYGGNKNSVLRKSVLRGFIWQIADHLIANGVVIREKGEWEEDTYGELHCNVCGTVQEDYPHRYDFCPNCGSDMRGGDMNERHRNMRKL